MIQTWALQDDGQTLLLASRGGALPEIVYWGPRLPEGTDPAVIVAAGALDVTGGMLDENPSLSICPEASCTFPGQPGLQVTEKDGTPLLPRFAFIASDGDEKALKLTCSDSSLALTYTAEFALDPQTGVISTRARISADRLLRLNWLAAPVFPALQSGKEMIDFSGRWTGEFRTERVPWSAGIRLRENRTGRTGHEHFPGLILPARGTTNTQGEAVAFHYGWSGGHRMVAEELSDGRRQVQFGHASGTETQPAASFETATLYAVRSDVGLNGCAVAFQRHLRDRIVTWPEAERPRPVHYNCWEAIYFDHDLDALKCIADRAAALGAERFVLDDGWFGKRGDDTSSLGDWGIDPRKYPDGFAPLISHVQSLNMTFGIWFEPEMVNPDSDLFRANPDWALGCREQVLGRNQMVLDVSRLDVRDYLFEQVDAVLGSYDVDYVKWDHNRVLPTPDAAQARGYYSLIARLRTAHPSVEFESCASGGGRIDYGAMAHCHRVWLSDSSDAMERLRIQHEAALFLPMLVTGSHVGPRHCHTSGRHLDMETRAWVAAQRHMGFEMDLGELDDREVATLRRITDWWKENRSWMARGDILRLDTDDPAVIGEMQISNDGDRFVVFAGLMQSTRSVLPRPLRLTGLDAASTYRLTPLSQSSVPEWQSRGAPLLTIGEATLPGQYLMHQGVTLPWGYPQTLWVFEGQRT
jgi:alpha-galactosidase